MREGSGQENSYCLSGLFVITNKTHIAFIFLPIEEVVSTRMPNEMDGQCPRAGR